MKNPSPKSSGSKTPHGPKRKPGVAGVNPATTEEFEREDMGIAPKE
jgi:hypothetical protein